MSAEKSLKYCAFLPTDNRILVTSDERGIPAIGLPDIKALFFRRAYPEDLKSVIDQLTDKQIKRMHSASAGAEYRWLNPELPAKKLSLSRIFNSDREVDILSREIKLINGYLQSATQGCRKKYGWFHNFVEGVEYHVDQKEILRAATVYKGKGMKIIASDVKEVDYLHYGFWRSRDTEKLEKNYPVYVSQLAEIIFSKGSFEGYMAKKKQLLLHSSQIDRVRIFGGFDYVSPRFQ